VSWHYTYKDQRLYYIKKNARCVRPPTSQGSAKREQEGPETQEDLEDSKANEKGGEGPFSRALGGAPASRRVRSGL